MRADAARVWKHATMMASINEELVPWMFMTSPKEARGLSLADIGDRVGKPLFVSWILLGHVVPMERMEVTIAELGPGYRFVERSGVATMRAWQDRRTVESVGDGSVVTDVVEVTPRLALMTPLVRGLLERVFDHRHRRLRALFGEG